MRAELEISLDTLWSNQVTLKVSTELDNPHTQTTRHLATLMTETVRTFAEELRSENERTAMAIETLNARHRQLDLRESDVDRRERAVSDREDATGDRQAAIGAREDQADERERERTAEHAAERERN